MHYSFYAFLFIAIWFTTLNLLLAVWKQKVSWLNFVVMSAAIVGCVYSALELG